MEWNRGAAIERLWSPWLGTLHVPYANWREGDHERGGLTLAAGPGITPGPVPGVHPIADLGATFAAAAGVRLDGVDGQPIEAILPPAERRSEAPRPRRVPRAAAGPRPAWAREDAAVSIAQAVRREAEAGLAAAVARAEATEQRLAAAQGRLQGLERDLSEREARLSARVDGLSRLADIGTMAAWLPHADVPESLFITVIMPTRDRAGLLRSAIDSVLASSYRTSS